MTLQDGQTQIQPSAQSGVRVNCGLTSLAAHHQLSRKPVTTVIVTVEAGRQATVDYGILLHVLGI